MDISQPYGSDTFRKILEQGLDIAAPGDREIQVLQVWHVICDEIHQSPRIHFDIDLEAPKGRVLPNKCKDTQVMIISSMSEMVQLQSAKIGKETDRKDVNPDNSRLRDESLSRWEELMVQLLVDDAKCTNKFCVLD